MRRPVAALGLCAVLLGGCARIRLDIGGAGASANPSDAMGYSPPSEILVITGTDENHYAITEPLVETRPSVVEADPVLTMGSEVPLVLGIEGAMLFVRAERAGEVVFDAIVDEEPFQLPAGKYDLTPYYRSCDGNCGLLDPPNDFCSVTAKLDEGARYRITIAHFDFRSGGECRFEVQQ